MAEPARLEVMPVTAVPWDDLAELFGPRGMPAEFRANRHAANLDL
jgi:hypothetical protein